MKINNKGQSLISVMLFIVVISIIVTLIIASSITDTKKLIAQKSYERAYSLSESYLGKIVLEDQTGDVFGLTDVNAITNLVKGSTTPLCTNITNSSEEVPSGRETPLTFDCSKAGPSSDSLVKCKKEKLPFMLASKLQTDKPLRINLNNSDLTANSSLNLIFADTETVGFLVRYEQGGIKRSVTFGASANAGEYPNFIPLSREAGPPQNFSNFVYIRQDANSTGQLNLNQFVTGITNYTSNFTPEELDRIAKSMSITSYPIRINLNTLKNLLGTNATLSNIDITFMGKDQNTATFTIVLDAFANLGDLQFNRYSCVAYDSAMESPGSNNLIGGFASAELEAYTPLNKSSVPIFNYGLFITNQNTGDTDGAIVTK